MNTTAKLKKHPKTGIFRYHRTIPSRLVGLLGEVDGFEFKPDRRYFEKSLGVREKPPANRMAAEIDKIYVEPQDGTRLGFILTRMGFEKQ